MFLQLFRRENSRRITYLFFLAFLFNVCTALCNELVNTKLFFRSEENQKKINSLCTKPFVLEQLTYESDVCVQPEEFFYLVDLQKNKVVTPQKLYTVVSRLFKKNKFSHVELVLQEGVFGVCLHFKLFGFKTFHTLRLHGILIGKYKYLQYYLLEPGDQFDEEKHARSLQKIVQAFKDEGFFEGYVTDQLVHDHQTNAIVTHLTLNRGTRYAIGNVSVAKKNKLVAEDEKEKGLKKIISRFSQSLSGKSYAKKLINKETEKLKRVLARKGFLHLEIQLRERICRKTKTVDLSFSINFVERRQFVFFGNHFFSHAQLLEAVLLFGRSACLVPASVLAQEIEAAYHKKGFWAVQVETREDQGRDFFLIKEGMRATIRNVSFVGAKNIKEKKHIKKQFRFFLRTKSFDQQELKKSFNALSAFYHSQGFWDMQVLKHDVSLVDEQKQVYDLKIFIQEGERTYLQSVSILDFPELLAAKPFSFLSKKTEPVFFDPRFVQEQKQWLQNHFQKKGYPHVRVHPELFRERNNAILQWHIDLDSVQKKFGKTIVLGSCTFPFKTIMRELCYKEGDLWDKEKLKRSSDRLRSLNLFERVHLYPDLSKTDDEKDLLLKLHKDDPFELRLRAGFGLQHVTRHSALGQGVTYKLGGTFLVKNPRNVGDNFAVDTDFSRAFRSINVEYFRPRFFAFPLRAHIKAYAQSYEQPGFIGCEKNLYEVVQQGFLLGLKDTFRFFDVGCNVGFEWMRTSIKEGMHQQAEAIANAINFESDLLGKKVPYFFIEPTFIVDRLDKKLNPTYGFFSFVTLKGMFPVSTVWSDSYFVKLLVEQSFFFSLGPVVCATHLRFGHIFHQQFKQIMPFERFYLGGAHSIRSYQTDLCPPLGEFTDEDGVKHCVPQGGKSTVNWSAELRIPVWQEIGFVLFQDLGTLVGKSLEKIDLSCLLAATGFGLRYNTPIGPLRFDIGWKWRVHPRCEYAYAWFLSLGHAF